jgi:alkylhydroperoxidase/carboxymuconolactone decarboxylase family protein YurZ
MPDLSEDRRLEIIDEFSAFSAEKVDRLLAGTLPAAFPTARPYIDAIAEAFSVDLPADRGRSTRTRLSREDRERILIALLASRGERLNLAVHIYVALGLEITPQEILHILLLTGVYTGLPNFASSLNVVTDTFGFLERLGVSELHPATILERLRKAFDLPPPDR